MYDLEKIKTRKDFDDYVKTLQSPEKIKSAEDWKVAIGLQKADGLTTSNYLYELAARNIEGELSFAEVEELLDEYYKKKEIKRNCKKK